MLSGVESAFEVTFLLADKVFTTYCAFLPFGDYHISPPSSSTVGGSLVRGHGITGKIAGVNLILCQRKESR